MRRRQKQTWKPAEIDALLKEHIMRITGLGERQVANRQFNIFVSSDLKALLQKRAKKLGVSCSAYGRWLLLKGMEQENNI